MSFEFSANLKSLKSVTDAGFIEGYAVRFGSRTQTDDQREYFTPATRFGLEGDTDSLSFQLFYEHGLLHIKDAVGSVNLKRVDDGIYLTGKFYMDTPAGIETYTKFKQRFESGQSMGFSTGSMKDLKVSKRQTNGSNEIQQWIIGEVSITDGPSDARATVTYLKSDYTTLYEDSDEETREFVINHMRERKQALKSSAVTPTADSPAMLEFNSNFKEFGSLMKQMVEHMKNAPTLVNLTPPTGNRPTEDAPTTTPSEPKTIPEGIQPLPTDPPATPTQPQEPTPPAIPSEEKPLEPTEPEPTPETSLAPEQALLEFTEMLRGLESYAKRT